MDPNIAAAAASFYALSPHQRALLLNNFIANSAPPPIAGGAAAGPAAPASTDTGTGAGLSTTASSAGASDAPTVAAAAAAAAAASARVAPSHEDPAGTSDEIALQSAAQHVEKALDDADTEFLAWQQAIRHLFSKDALEASGLREAQRRLLSCILHCENWTEEAPLVGEYSLSNRDIEYSATWEAFMGAGKSLILVLISMIELERLSPDFVANLKSANQMPHRKVLIEAAGKSNAAFEEMQRYLERYGEPPKEEARPRKKRQLGVAPQPRPVDDKIDRWSNPATSGKMRLPCTAMNIQESSMLEFLDHVHFYETGDAKLLRDDDVKLALLMFESELKTSHGDASKLKPALRVSTSVADLRRKISRAWNLQRAWVVVGNPNRLHKDMAAVKAFRLFAMLEIDEMDVAAFNMKEDAPHAAVTQTLRTACLQVGVTGSIYRRDKMHEHLKAPIAGARALAPELMDSKDLKTLSYRPRFASLKNDKGQVVDQYTASLTTQAVYQSARTALSRTPQLILDACLKETVLDFLREEGLPWSIVIYVGMPQKTQHENTNALMMHICEIINGMKLSCPVNNQPLEADWVGSGSLKRWEIEKKLDDFDKGIFRILVNHEIVSRGRDFPHMGATICMRHFGLDSISSYKQGTLARALRWLSPAKAKTLTNWRPEDVAKLEQKKEQTALLTEMDITGNTKVLNSVISEQGLNKTLGCEWALVSSSPPATGSVDAGSTRPPGNELIHADLANKLKQKVDEGYQLVFTEEEWDSEFGSIELSLDHFVKFFDAAGEEKYVMPCGVGHFKQQMSEHPVQQSTLAMHIFNAKEKIIKALHTPTGPGNSKGSVGQSRARRMALLIYKERCEKLLPFKRKLESIVENIKSGFQTSDGWIEGDTSYTGPCFNYQNLLHLTTAALNQPSKLLTEMAAVTLVDDVHRRVTYIQSIWRGCKVSKLGHLFGEDMPDLPQSESQGHEGVHAMAIDEANDGDETPSEIPSKSLVNLIACCRRSKTKDGKSMTDVNRLATSSERPLESIREALQHASNHTGRAYTLLLSSLCNGGTIAQAKGKWDAELNPPSRLENQPLVKGMRLDQMSAELSQLGVGTDDLDASLLELQRSDREKSMHRKHLEKMVTNAREREKIIHRNTLKMKFAQIAEVYEATPDEARSAHMLIAKIEREARERKEAAAVASSQSAAASQEATADCTPSRLPHILSPKTRPGSQPRIAISPDLNIEAHVWFKESPDSKRELAKVAAVQQPAASDAYELQYKIHVHEAAWTNPRLELGTKRILLSKRAQLEPCTFSGLDQAALTASPPPFTHDELIILCLAHGKTFKSKRPQMRSAVKEFLALQQKQRGDFWIHESTCILDRLMDRADAKQWFNDSVAGTEGATIPIDYKTIKTNLAGGAYKESIALASDVRHLVTSVLQVYPNSDDERHRAALDNLAEFEKQYHKRGLAVDDGQAARAAKVATKAATAALEYTRRRQGRHTFVDNEGNVWFSTGHKAIKRRARRFVDDGHVPIDGTITRWLPANMESLDPADHEELWHIEYDSFEHNETENMSEDLNESELKDALRAFSSADPADPSALSETESSSEYDSSSSNGDVDHSDADDPKWSKSVRMQGTDPEHARMSIAPGIAKKVIIDPRSNDDMRHRNQTRVIEDGLEFGDIKISDGLDEARCKAIGDLGFGKAHTAVNVIAQIFHNEPARRRSYEAKFKDQEGWTKQYYAKMRVRRDISKVDARLLKIGEVARDKAKVADLSSVPHGIVVIAGAGGKNLSEGGLSDGQYNVMYMMTGPRLRHKRPPGRPPRGKEWNQLTGQYVDARHGCASTSAAASAAATGSSSAVCLEDSVEMLDVPPPPAAPTSSPAATSLSPGKHLSAGGGASSSRGSGGGSAKRARFQHANAAASNADTDADADAEAGTRSRKPNSAPTPAKAEASTRGKRDAISSTVLPHPKRQASGSAEDGGLPAVASSTNEEMDVSGLSIDQNVLARGQGAAHRLQWFRARIIKFRNQYPPIQVRYLATEGGATLALLLPEPNVASVAKADLRTSSIDDVTMADA